MTVANFSGKDAKGNLERLIPGGSRWKHYKGSVMVVLGIAELESTGEAVVCYHPEFKRDRVKVRPLGEWVGWVSGEVGWIRRYTLVKDDG